MDDYIECENCGLEDHDGACAQAVRAKWAMDGANTLSEAASKLEGLAQLLRSEEAAGKQLIEPIIDDYGYYR